MSGKEGISLSVSPSSLSNSFNLEIGSLVLSKPNYWHLSQRREAAAVWSHVKGICYPRFGFQSARVDKEGPLPTPLPLARTIINQITTNLFGVVPELLCSNEKVKSALWPVWEYQLVPMLQTIRNKGGVFGSALIQFQVTALKEVKFTLHDCRHYYAITNPINVDEVLAIVLRYPILNPTPKSGSSSWIWHTEIWTDKVCITLKSKGDGIENFGFNYGDDLPFMYSQAWEQMFIGDLSEDNIESTTEHGLGVLPFVQITNKLDVAANYPHGDLFNLRHILRRLDLVYHLMDISNQTEARPTKVFINAVDKEEVPSMVGPGATIELESAVTEDGIVLPASVQQLEAIGGMRTHMTTFACDLRSMLYETVGVVLPRAEDITNKGNLTPAVMGQMYSPMQIGLTAYQIQYGDFGIIPLLKKLCIALKLAKSETELLSTFKLKWGVTAPVDEQQKLYEVERILRELDAGLISNENAIRKISALEGIDKDIDTWIAKQVKEIETAKTEKLAMEKEKHQADLAKAKDRGNPTAKEPTGKPRVEEK